MNTQLFASLQDRGTPTDRSTEFVPVEGGGSATTDAGTFLVIAYVLMWMATMLFIVQTWRKMNRAQSKLGRLQEAVAKRPPSGG